MACDSYTVLMLHMDGTDASTTFTDSSLVPHTMTANGNAQIDTAQSKFGGASGIFDGTGDFVTSPSSADWNLGPTGSGNDWTIDFWIRFNTLPGGGTGSWMINTYGDDATNGWYLLYIDDLAIVELWAGSGTGSDITYSVPSTGVWYHWAVVKNGTTITFYVDGVSKGTFTDHDMNNDAQPLSIGASDGGTRPFDGWLDEVRISKGIARWTANFTPPTSAYCADLATRVPKMMLVGCG